MPLYFFNLYNGTGFVPDEEGRELPDPDAARAEAIHGARSLIADEVLKGRLDLNGRLDVLDGSGSLLFTIFFSDAVESPPAAAAVPDPR